MTSINRNKLKKIENIMEFIVTRVLVEECFNESVWNSDFEWAKT